MKKMHVSIVSFVIIGLQTDNTDKTDNAKF